MAKRKIVISEYDNIAALMEEDRAVEFIIHRGDMLLGDVYLASVENILPSIDAAFVNVGGDKMGFLHSSDVPGKGDLKNRLEPKQQLVVQIMKEPTGHKGPRVSTNISLPGRFLVMMPESKGISISRKIVELSERSRLKSVVSLVKPAGVGVIIRTEAANQKESDITEDFETLLERWQNIVSMADTANPPTLLYRDQDLLYRVIREAVTEDVSEIIVDTAFGQQRAMQLLQTWNMDKGVKVSHYQGTQSILVGTGVDKEIKLALQTKVPLPSGGYLYIQPTEALTVVDVNSGKFTSLHSQAETIKQTNLESCKEIARQLRLRNIGGMIVVDFIDMESRANQLAVLQSFENELAPDKAKPQIGQLSDLGLVEMTRHRQGQSLSEIFTRRCTVCTGTGHALEEFSWLHHGADGGDNRGGRNSRSKLPTRQPNRSQQVPKPAASVNQKKDRPKVALGDLAETPESKKEKAGAAVTPGNILLNNLSGQKKQSNGLEPEKLVEALNEKLQQGYGIQYARVVKLAFMPVGMNGVLTRMNPKANDIVTLVYSIETAVHDFNPAQETPEFEGLSSEGGEPDDADVEEGDAEDGTPQSGSAHMMDPVEGSPHLHVDAGFQEEPLAEPDFQGEIAIDTVEPNPQTVDLEEEEEAEFSFRRTRKTRMPSVDVEEEISTGDIESPLFVSDDELDEDDSRLMQSVQEQDDEEEGDDDDAFEGDESEDGLDLAHEEGDWDEQDEHHEDGQGHLFEPEHPGHHPSVATKPRRKGRPAKRSIKKPPLKR